MNRACKEVEGFSELLHRFERNISILGRSVKTFDNYSRHVAVMALHFKILPTELDQEQVKDYLFELQQRSKTPSQSYFKHTVYGLRFLLKTEGFKLRFFTSSRYSKSEKTSCNIEQGRDLADAEKCRFAETQIGNWFNLRLWSSMYGT